MKRHPELRGLSEDHHNGLVLARKAKLAHIEESLIAPGLDRAGTAELTVRLLEEPRVLRACVRPGSGRSATDLARFGDLLEGHIRFEERELFEVAERRLTAGALHAIAEACRDVSRSASTSARRRRREP